MLASMLPTLQSLIEAIMAKVIVQESCQGSTCNRRVYGLKSYSYLYCLYFALYYSHVSITSPILHYQEYFITKIALKMARYW